MRSHRPSRGWDKKLWNNRLYVVELKVRPGRGLEMKALKQGIDRCFPGAPDDSHLKVAASVTSVTMVSVTLDPVLTFNGIMVVQTFLCAEFLSGARDRSKRQP